jgi:hypothetical protein
VPHSSGVDAGLVEAERPWDRPFEAMPLRGPFAVLADYCRTLPAGTSCEVGDSDDDPGLTLVHTDAGDEAWIELALRTPRGWFVSRRLMEGAHADGPAGST